MAVVDWWTDGMVFRIFTTFNFHNFLKSQRCQLIYMRIGAGFSSTYTLRPCVSLFKPLTTEMLSMTFWSKSLFQHVLPKASNGIQSAQAITNASPMIYPHFCNCHIKRWTVSVVAVQIQRKTPENLTNQRARTNGEFQSHLLSPIKLANPWIQIIGLTKFYPNEWPWSCVPDK